MEPYTNAMTTTETRAQQRRNAQAAATRLDIVLAARRLMLERGYVSTSIGAIAAEAGVAVQTIYNSLGSKAEVLAAVLEAAEAGQGQDAPSLVPAALRLRVAGARSAADVIRVLAAWFAEVNERGAGVFRVLGQAAAVDPDFARLEDRRATQRLHSLGDAAAALRARNGLRSGLSDHEAAAAIWAIGHPQVYRALVVDIGWSTATYREWLEKTLTATLA